MRRQIRRHSTRRSSSSSRRRLGHLWSRLFRAVGRARGHAALLDPVETAQVTLGLHSYHTAREESALGGGVSGACVQMEAEVGGCPSFCSPAAVDLQACTPQSPTSPLSLHSVNSSDPDELSPVSSRGAVFPESESPTYQAESAAPRSRRPSKKLVLELAINLKGVSFKRYSPLGPFSPTSPPALTTSPLTQRFHPQGPEVTSPSVIMPPLAEESDSHSPPDLPSEERRSSEGNTEGAS